MVVMMMMVLFYRPQTDWKLGKEGMLVSHDKKPIWLSVCTSSRPKQVNIVWSVGTQMQYKSWIGVWLMGWSRSARWTEANRIQFELSCNQTAGERKLLVSDHPMNLNRTVVKQELYIQYSLAFFLGYPKVVNWIITGSSVTNEMRQHSTLTFLLIWCDPKMA